MSRTAVFGSFEPSCWYRANECVGAIPTYRVYRLLIYSCLSGQRSGGNWYFIYLCQDVYMYTRPFFCFKNHLKWDMCRRYTLSLKMRVQ